VIKDEATGMELEADPDSVRLFILEFAGPLQFLTDLQSGIFSLTRSEYERLPAVLIDIRRIHSRIVHAHGHQGS
jgi:hypothetical protein